MRVSRMLVVLLGCFFGAGSAAGQSACAGGRALTAKERIALREIQARIDESVEADEAKDVTAKMRHMTPDATVQLLDGNVLNRKETEAGTRRDYDWILAVSDETRVQVTCIELHGKEATVSTDQRFVRMVPDRKDGSPHELITTMKHRETWVYNDGGWLNKHTVELERGPIYLDGQPFTP